VSTVGLPVDDDSAALHVLAQEPPEQERQVGNFVTGTAERLEAYGSVFSLFHLEAWKEVESMARQRRPGFQPDWDWYIEQVGMEELIRRLGPEILIRQIGMKEVVRQIGAKELLQEVGPREILSKLEVEEILANLPAAKRTELKRHLTEEKGTS
jgi:hypothetical protein